MKRFFKITVLTSALALCAAGTASANQLLVFVTSTQLINAIGQANGTNIGGGVTVGSATTYGANCNLGLTDCGVFAVGASSAVTSGSVSTTAVGGYSSPVPTGTAAWVGVTLASIYNGYEVGKSTDGVTQEEFITANTGTVWSGGGSCTTNTVAGCYNGSGTSSSQFMNGVAAMNASTNVGTIGFLLTFATNVSAGTTVNLTLDLLASQLGTGVNNGLQGTNKSMASTLTLNGLTTVATPEPGSIGLLFSGMGALGFAAWRRRRLVGAAVKA